MVLKQITSYLEENNYEINIPVSDFVSEVSNIYHEIESKVYNESHQNMFDVLSVYWREIISDNYNLFGDDLIVLDYGCGTGFATIELLKSPLKSKIKKIICYDLSSHMIDECKENIFNKYLNEKEIEFQFLSGSNGLEKIISTKYDLIVTNSLLHHLLDLTSFFNFITSNLNANGVYIAGHEPNKNYYYNKILLKKTRAFRKYKKIKSILNIHYILNKLKIKKVSVINIVKETNKRLLQKKVINKELPNLILPKFVDIHVPIGFTTDQVWGEIGFNPDLILNKYLPTFKVIDFNTYFHIKDYKAHSSVYWKRVLKSLKIKYPSDGADIIILFQKG